MKVDNFENTKKNFNKYCIASVILLLSLFSYNCKALKIKYYVEVQGEKFKKISIFKKKLFFPDQLTIDNLSTNSNKN